MKICFYSMFAAFSWMFAMQNGKTWTGLFFGILGVYFFATASTDEIKLRKDLGVSDK